MAKKFHTLKIKAVFSTIALKGDLYIANFIGTKHATYRHIYMCMTTNNTFKFQIK